jgi:hypothetical protein
MKRVSPYLCITKVPCNGMELPCLAEAVWYP